MSEQALTTAGPVRTCIGCRKRAAAAALIRVVAVVEDDVSVARIDGPAVMPGRGAWLHRDLDCLRTAVRRKAFGPALRVSALMVDSAALEIGIAVASSGGCVGQPDAPRSE